MVDGRQVTGATPAQRIEITRDHDQGSWVARQDDGALVGERIQQDRTDPRSDRQGPRQRRGRHRAHLRRQRHVPGTEDVSARRSGATQAAALSPRRASCVRFVALMRVVVVHRVGSNGQEVFEPRDDWSDGDRLSAGGVDVCGGGCRRMGRGRARTAPSLTRSRPDRSVPGESPSRFSTRSTPVSSNTRNVSGDDPVITSCPPVATRRLCSATRTPIPLDSTNGTSVEVHRDHGLVGQRSQTRLQPRRGRDVDLARDPDGRSVAPGFDPERQQLTHSHCLLAR